MSFSPINFLTTGIIEQLPWENVELLSLRSNLLQASLRVLPPFLQFFSVSQNKLTGPSSSCNLSFVVYVDLSNNSLSVAVPENLVNSTLNVLDVRMNKFRGSIPQTFPEDCNFNNLYLNGNQLEGPLPPSLVSCGYLNALDVGNNKINVNFPDWPADLAKLQVLILRSNRFHGLVGNSNSNAGYLFPKLLIIDLSHTAFAGLLPTEYFQKFQCMMHVDNKMEYMVQVYLAEYYSAIHLLC